LAKKTVFFVRSLEALATRQQMNVSLTNSDHLFLQRLQANSAFHPFGVDK